MILRCNSCGAWNSRQCNGDNECCVVCGTPDDFKRFSEQEYERAILDNQKTKQLINHE